VAKRLGTPYRPGIRSRDWLKIAHRRSADCVICGLTEGAVPVAMGLSVVRFGSFALGVYDGEGQLTYAGNVGTGWDSRSLRELVGLLRSCSEPPFRKGFGPPRRIARATTWVRPEVVVEIAYRELTPEGLLRHPSLLRVRSDREPRTCGPLAGPVPPPG
jgi:bifunctional non-homologous end joining protein LigD